MAPALAERSRDCPLREEEMEKYALNGSIVIMYHILLRLLRKVIVRFATLEFLLDAIVCASRMLVLRSVAAVIGRISAVPCLPFFPSILKRNKTPVFQARHDGGWV